MCISFWKTCLCAFPEITILCNSTVHWSPRCDLTIFSIRFLPFAPISDVTFALHSTYAAFQPVDIFRTSFFTAFLTVMEKSIKNVPFLTPRIKSGLLNGMVMSVVIRWFHSLVTWLPWLVSTCNWWATGLCHLF